ncbi:MAG: SH3 domain-containing protein [Thermomicrobiales bacterium]
MSLIAPVMTFAAQVDGGMVITNTGGDGATLRAEASAEAAAITTLAEGTAITILDGPLYDDAGNAWYQVSADGMVGFVSTAFVGAGSPSTDPATEADITPTEPSAEQPTQEPAGIPWAQPIDHGVVVVNVNDGSFPDDGLAVRASASPDAAVLGRLHVGERVEVTGEKVWPGDAPYLPVNYGDGGGFVNAYFIVLDSEAVVTEEPTEEVVLPTEVPTEEIVVPTDVPTEEVVPTEDVVTPTDAPTEEVVPTEVPTEETAGPTDAPAEATAEDVTKAPADENAGTPAAVPTDEVEATAEVTDIPVEDAAGTPVVEPTEVVTEDATKAPNKTVVNGAPSTPVVVPSETETATEAPATPVASETAAATETPVEGQATALDPSLAIGSATVTGTNGDGIRCRVAPDSNANTIVVLAEGTKVQVFEATGNGWLQIGCGGQLGYGNINYLWSGGASDAQINAGGRLSVSGTGNGLNCRIGPGTNYNVITVLYDGTAVTVRGQAQNGWTPVTCGGQNGYVSSEYISVSPTGNNGGGSNDGGTATGTATVTGTGGDGVRCRTGAGTSNGVIMVVGEGMRVTVRGASSGGWTPVTCGGQNGFISSEYLSTTSGGGSNGGGNNGGGSNGGGTSSGSVTVTGTGGGLNCRIGPGTSYNVITTLFDGTTVPVRGAASNGWQPVTCGGQNGYVSTEWITASGGSNNGGGNNGGGNNGGGNNGGGQFVTGDHAKVNTDALNLRYEPSLGAGISTTVPGGIVVEITGGASNGFYPVNYDGLKGWMSGEYLSKTSDPLSRRGGSGNPGTGNPGGGGGSATGNAMVDFAMGYLGYPYVWATHGPYSFDCSGFTYWVTMNVMGIDIGTGTWTQSVAGTPVSRSNLQPGDLVFFQNTYAPGLSHVGIYIGGGQFIHAENENTGVRISDLNSQYYSSRWYGAVRL